MYNVHLFYNYLYWWFDPFWVLLVTTEYASDYPVWTSGRATGQPFALQGTVFYPEEIIMYPFDTNNNVIEFQRNESRYLFINLALKW